MPIVGFTFRKMEADRKKDEVKGEVKLDTKQNITGVKKTTETPFDKETLSMDFEFVIDYNPGIAQVRINGSVLYMTDKAEGI